MRIRHRIDGVLQEVRVLPEGSAEGLISRLKMMASMDAGERRLPQDGRIDLRTDRSARMTCGSARCPPSMASA